MVICPYPDERVFNNIVFDDQVVQGVSSLYWDHLTSQNPARKKREALRGLMGALRQKRSAGYSGDGTENFYVGSVEGNYCNQTFL